MFDLGACPGGDTFMKIASTSLDLQDLRPAYRWAALSGRAWLTCSTAGRLAGRRAETGSQQLPALPRAAPHRLACRRLQDNLRRKAEEAGASGYATPLSQLSGDESGRATPTMGRAGTAGAAGTGAAAAPAPPGVAAAAAAGSHEAADALAPPDVRQRVLSDAAAELLADQLDARQREALLAGGSAAAAAAERSAGAAEAEAAGPGGGSDAQMLQLYQAARRATLQLQPQLQHQSSDVTLGQPTPRGAAGSPGSLPGEPESTLGTPATPSTGGFSFTLPASSQQQQQRLAMQATPGLLPGGLGGGEGGAPEATPAGAGLPPFTDGRARGGHAEHTGIRLSVARRLSEHAERRRSMHTPSTGGGSAGAASAARSPFGSAGGTPAPGGGAAGQPHLHAHHRVIELLPADALPEVDGLEKEGDAAVFRLLSAPCSMPPDEQPAPR